MMNCRRRTLIFLAVVLAYSIEVQVSAQAEGVHPRRSSTEEPIGTDDVITPTYAPVTLSSLASFARRFWSTMASMAATTNDGLTREDDNVTITTPTAFVPVKETESILQSENDESSRRTSTGTRRWDRQHYQRTTSKTFDNRKDVPESERNRETNFRLARLREDLRSKNLHPTDRGIEQLTTPCNETTSSLGVLGRRASTTKSSTWPPPPPKILSTQESPAGEDLGDLFSSEHPSGSYSPDFEEIPGIASPVVTTESLRSDRTQSVSDFQLSKTTKDDLSHFTVEDVDYLPASNSFWRTTTTTPPHREFWTESPPTPDTEVSLVEIFDQDIIKNKSLLASSMFKLSSILTASLLTEESAVNANGSTTEGSTAMTTKQTSTVENVTSDFDFSDLFTVNNSTKLPIATLATSTHHSVDPVEDDFMLNDEIVLLTDSNDGNPSDSADRLASLMSTGVVESFAVQDIDDNDQDTDSEVAGEDFDSEFEEAGLIQGSRDQQPGVKRLNRFSAQIRLPIKNLTEEPGECLFNVTDQSKMCEWTFDSQSSVHWLFGLGETAFMSGGPTLDSNGQTDGGYAFMDTSSGLQGPSNEIQRGSLESPLMSKTAPEGRCFTFWYNIGGLSADRLRVLLIPEEQFHATSHVASRMPSFTVLWEQKDTTNGTWLKGEVLYTFSKEHRLIFEGFARSGSDTRRKFQGFLAVDDLFIDSDSCKGFCTFEGVLCEWENEGEKDDFDWELARGSDSHLTGPMRDHGDGPEGGFMYIDTAFPRRPGDVARIHSPELPSNDEGPICFRFWTHMYGNGIGTLRVVLIDSSNADEKKIIWEVSGESGNSWHMAQVTVASSSAFRLSLEGVVGRNALGRIAIDDLSFGPGPCPSSPQTALPLRGDCTFESDECGWVNAGSGDQYDWLRTSSGQALLPGQGPNSGYRPPEPLSDHTTGLSSGFYLTMERSTIPPRGGDQAYVVGPTLEATNGGSNRCLSFYGYMHERSVDAAGPGLGSLRVYLRVGSSSVLRPIWRLINYEHPDWFFAQAPINTDDKFQVVIGGTWGSTRQGAIAVDDFTFFEGNCSVIPAEAKVISGECNFDSNMCEWNSGANRSRELSTWQLATSVRRPSNLDDHTYRASAGYVFFDIFSQQPHLVRLESPEIVAHNVTDDDDDNNLDASDDDVASDTEHCLTFWFAPFGSSRNTFLRILQRDVANNNETQVWEVTTANFQAFRPEWVYGQVAVNITYTHRIVFEGSSNNGGFALDDVMFVPRTCQ